MSVDLIYGHMEADQLLVRPGQRVRAGQRIARVGSAGQSTGPHCHFEVWTAPGRVGGSPIDPAPWLRGALDPGAAAPTEGGTGVSWYGDPVWLADVLRAEGVNVVEAPGWRDRGEGDFRDVWGIVCHHTGGSRTPATEIMYGTPALTGLLSQIHLAQDGTATVCGVGVAWHAGLGSHPGLPEDDANYYTIGIEAANNGTEGWQPAQYWAYVKVCAAICRKLGYGAERVIAHKEWAGRKQGKWDPGQLDMDRFRTDVQAQIERRNGGFLMALSEAKQDELYNLITKELGYRFQSRFKDEAGRQSDFRDSLVGYVLELDAKIEQLDRWRRAKDERDKAVDAKLDAILAALGRAA
ncbi:N-acetylmuramoyl-L-alanine amidase [Nocardia niigatensis]